MHNIDSMRCDGIIRDMKLWQTILLAWVVGGRWLVLYAIVFHFIVLPCLRVVMGQVRHEISWRKVFEAFCSMRPVWKRFLDYTPVKALAPPVS